MGGLSKAPAIWGNWVGYIGANTEQNGGSGHKTCSNEILNAESLRSGDFLPIRVPGLSDPIQLLRTPKDQQSRQEKDHRCEFWRVKGIACWH